MSRKDVLRASMPAISYLGHKIKPGGIAEYFLEGSGYHIAYTSTCSHCQHITEAPTVKELREKTNVCRGCMRMICEKCGNKPCLPWEKQCEYQEREYLKAKIQRGAWGCY